MSAARAIRRRLASAWAILVYSTFLANWAFPYVIQALRNQKVLTGLSYDGPFQHYNALRRIDAGLRGGVDFHFFHGIGIPYLHYPLYLAFGGTVHASEVARYLTGPICYLVGAIAVGLAVTRTLRDGLFLAAVIALLGDYLGLTLLIQPGHSLIGVRSTMPLLVFAALLLPRGRSRAAAVGGLLAIGLMMGVEQAMAMGVATAALLVLDLVRRGPRGHKLRELAGIGLTTACVFVLLVTAIGGPSAPWRVLRYNLVDVPADQFWYFGAPPVPVLYKWSDLLAQDEFCFLIMAAAVLLAGGLSGLLRAKAEEDARFPLAASALLACGLLSLTPLLACFGGHYMLPLRRITAVVAVAGGYEVWARLRRGSPEARRAAGALGPVAWLAMLAMLARGYPGKMEYKGLYDLGRMAADARQVLEAAKAPGPGQLAPDFEAYLQQATRAIDADRASRPDLPLTIWSDYAGLLEAHYGVLGSAPFDYIIHALGPANRREYVDAFRRERPSYVQTIRGAHCGAFGEWLRDSSWEFYEEVIRNYDVLAVTDRMVIWRRKPSPWRPPATESGYDGEIDLASAPLRASRRFFPAIDLPVGPGLPEGSVLVVTVEYTTRNRLRRLPVLGQVPRYLIAIKPSRQLLPVSVPPDAGEWTFPVVVEPGRDPTLRFTVRSLVSGVGLQVRKVRWRALAPDEAPRVLFQ